MQKDHYGTVDAAAPLNNHLRSRVPCAVGDAAVTSSCRHPTFTSETSSHVFRAFAGTLHDDGSLSRPHACGHLSTTNLLEPGRKSGVRDQEWDETRLCRQTNHAERRRSAVGGNPVLSETQPTQPLSAKGIATKHRVPAGRLTNPIMHGSQLAVCDEKSFDKWTGTCTVFLIYEWLGKFFAVFDG